MTLLGRLASRSVTGLTRVACVLALIGLFILCGSVLWPAPLPVIFAMSGGHLIGLAAVACYLLAVLLDLARREGKLPPRPNSSPEAAPIAPRDRD